MHFITVSFFSQCLREIEYNGSDVTLPFSLKECSGGWRSQGTMYYAQGGGQGWALFTKKATIKMILLKILKNKALTLSNLQDSVNEY